MRSVPIATTLVCLALFAHLVGAAPAHAVSIDVANSQFTGASLTDQSGPGQLSFELDEIPLAPELPVTTETTPSARLSSHPLPCQL